MPSKKTSSNNKLGFDFLENPWAKLISALTGIGFIFGLGYTIGQFKKEIDFKVEKLELLQSYQEKLQKEINDCKEVKYLEQKKSIEDLKTIVKELQKKMKNRNLYIIAFLFTLLLGACFVIYFINDYNDELQRKLDAKDLLLNDVKARDSVFTKNNKEFSEVITKYVNNCSFTLNNKNISTAELVKMTNKALTQVELLNDSLTREKNISKSYYNQLVLINDSFGIYKTIINKAKSDYGIRYNIVSNNKNTYIIKEFSKADSGLLLLPFYKTKLKKDTLGKWIISYEKTSIIKKAK